MAERWEPTTSGASFPSDAVIAGVDKKGVKIYCGRAEHGGELVVAKIIPSKAHVSFRNHEYMKPEFEILCGNFRWEHASNGNIVDGAMTVGRTTTGEELYMGRGTYNGSMTPGKIHKSHGCMYIPYGGKEIALKEYEVLVRL